MVTGLGLAPWQNAVVERHGALFKMACDKACSLVEAPSTEAEVDEMIDHPFAEFNRRVGRSGFSPGQRVFGRQLRLPSSLLEDDFIDPIHDRARRQPRDAAERGHADDSCLRMRRRRRSPSGVHGSTHSTLKTTAGISGWRARLHLQTEGRTPKDGADLACASCVENRSLDGTRQSGCTCGTVCTAEGKEAVASLRQARHSNSLLGCPRFL